MNKALFAAVFLIQTVATAQTPPSDQSRQIDLRKEKERLRQIAL
jgi:hypothetical protein